MAEAPRAKIICPSNAKIVELVLHNVKLRGAKKLKRNVPTFKIIGQPYLSIYIYVFCVKKKKKKKEEKKRGNKRKKKEKKRRGKKKIIGNKRKKKY